VVGAGHLKGLSAALQEGREDPEATTRALDLVPPPGKVPWFTLIFATFLLSIFGWGFWHGGFDLGTKLVLDWTIITAVGGAIGSAAAGGHPLSILAAAVVSPVTPLIPALSSGMVSAFTEAWLRNPTYQDRLDLRHDTGTLRGWWRNRFARVIVNFVLTNTGTALAVWVAGAKLVHGIG
jgi:pheromone shutdown protein TraB